MLLDLLETYVSEEETIRIIAEQIINGECETFSVNNVLEGLLW